MYSNVMGRGGGVCFFQTHSRDQGSLFLVIFAMYFKVIEERVRFVVIVAMHFDLMGRGVWFFQNGPVNRLTTPVG